ncbi:hypothetical protein FACS189429_3590 [Bacteroidia bacterium]|nr:hypothetical protein FACS189429_3590 [Bacteroidia bacterium]
MLKTAIDTYMENNANKTFSVSIFSAGGSYSQNGGFSTNIGWINYSKNGIEINPSLTLSYSYTYIKEISPIYADALPTIEDKSLGEPIPYTKEAASEFIKNNPELKAQGDFRTMINGFPK